MTKYRWLEIISTIAWLAGGGMSVISLSDISLVRSYNDVKDYGKGLKMNFAPGDPFVILNHAVAANGNSRQVEKP